MDAQMSYDFSRFDAMYKAMSARERNRVFRSAMRQEANIVLKTARTNLKSSGLKADSTMLKCIRAKVFKRVVGFSVKANAGSTKKGGNGEGFYLNGRGLWKPVLMWAETGTRQRSTSGSMFFLRKGLNRGRMPKYGFMEKTRMDTAGKVTEDTHRMVVKEIEKIAKKYGCN